MSRFKQIDAKLNEVAKKLKAEVATNGSGYTIEEVRVPDEKIEERRILWIDGDIGKGIIISPNFAGGNIDSPSWDFVNIAWLQSGPSNTNGRPFWKNDLLEKEKFETIEKNIDQLLNKSIENLKAIKKEDLKYN